jgi:hypothetical protein
MLPEPNFRVRPDEFVGRIREVEIFCQALQQGLVTGRTASFAILGDWGIGKSSLLLKLAALCSQSSFAMLPVFVSVSTDIPDYLRLAEVLLSHLADVLLTASKMQARLRAKLRNWRSERVHFAASPRNVNLRACFSAREALSSDTCLQRPGMIFCGLRD